MCLITYSFQHLCVNPVAAQGLQYVPSLLSNPFSSGSEVIVSCPCLLISLILFAVFLNPPILLVVLWPPAPPTGRAHFQVSSQLNCFLPQALRAHPAGFLHWPVTFLSISCGFYFFSLSLFFSDPPLHTPKLEASAFCPLPLKSPHPSSPSFLTPPL